MELEERPAQLAPERVVLDLFIHLLPDLISKDPELRAKVALLTNPEP